MKSLSNKSAVVLLAEDDPGDQELVRRVLEDCRIHCRLTVVNDGEQALDYLFGRGAYAGDNRPPLPDLFLLDLNMPIIDGNAVLKRVKTDPRLRQVPIVILTTSRRQEDVQHAYDLGVNSYIAKPATIDQFTEIVRRLSEYWFCTVILPNSQRERSSYDTSQRR
jgi:CheY-like chemotaxis protein